MIALKTVCSNTIDRLSLFRKPASPMHNDFA
jgi:hypothetical protein